MKEEDRGVRGNLLFCEKWSLLFMVLMSNITIKKKNNGQNLHCLEIQRSHGSLRNNDCINQILCCVKIITELIACDLV